MKSIRNIEQFLKEYPEDINTVDDYGISLLSEAVARERIPDIKLLLARGADPNLRCGYGCAAIHGIHVGELYEEILCLLLNAGANINAVENRGRTALHHVLLEESPCAFSACRILIEHGIDATIKNDDGFTALDREMKYWSHRKNIIEYLKQVMEEVPLTKRAQ